jgi:hypothetical protein
LITENNFKKKLDLKGTWKYWMMSLDFNNALNFATSASSEKRKSEAGGKWSE